MFTETRSSFRTLHLLNGATVMINPAHIVIAEPYFERLPRPKDEGFYGYQPEIEETGTMLHLTNGKVLTVTETLAELS